MNSSNALPKGDDSNHILEVPIILSFYDPHIKARDPRGRTLEDILARDDQWFEMCHDYVQILFPLPEGSMFNWLAPVIDRVVFDAFRSRPELRAEMRKAFTRMLSFYGLRLVSAIATSDEANLNASSEKNEASEGTAVKTKQEAEPVKADENKGGATNSASATSSGVRIERAAHFSRAARNWIMRFNHNHLRITRILRSLRVLGLQAEARAFLAALEEIQVQYKRFGNDTLKYWHRAIEQPLWIAPDFEEVDWLRDVETESGQ